MIHFILLATFMWNGAQYTQYIADFGAADTCQYAAKHMQENDPDTTWHCVVSDHTWPK